MLDEAIIAFVLLLMAIETAAGLATWSSGGEERACMGLNGMVPCLYYLIRTTIPEEVGLAFIVIGVGLGWGWWFAIRKRTPSAEDGAKGEKTRGKTMLVIAVMLLADVAIGALLIRAIGRPYLVVGTLVVLNVIALASSAMKKQVTTAATRASS